MNIGQRIKERRLAIGMSVDKLAEKLGLNRATIYRYESRDIENMPTSVLEPLANALLVSPSYLMGWTDDPSVPFQKERIAANVEEVTADASSIIERLNAVMLDRGMTKTQLAKYCGIPKTTLYNIMASEENAQKAKLETMRPIAAALGITLDYLIYGNAKNIDDIRNISKCRFPMLGEVACGNPIYANEERESYIESGTTVQADFCLKAKGDSMVGARIFDGDIVFVRKTDIVNNGEIAVVLIGDEATLKRVYYYPDKQKLILQAENPKYEPFVYIGTELDDVRIIGKAIAFQSDIR